MLERAFVLVPLLEIAPAVEVPGRGLARDFANAVAGQSISRLD
jgi:2-amino-4-hydroxy-6-hydroxymethyldihydropteridine diphosphokinase